MPQTVASGSSSPTARTNNLASLANDSVTFAAAPGQAAGKAYIRYADSRQTSHKLVKPLIVLEGYDQHYIAPHIAPLNYSLDQFLVDIKTKGSFDLSNALSNTGDYDIVFVDYANGTDDILLNAGLFEQVLNWVNTHKDPASTEQNVVMGMSMGGLVGRYKLAQLEKANPGSTHVRLLVLQDSPQRGANVPLGISAAIRQANNCFLRGISVKDINKYIQEAVALLDQPATRQLVKYQTLGPNDSDFFANTFVDGPYRQMISYAAPYKIVAVSQGSQCGVSLFPPYSELLRASASSFNGVLGYIIQTYLPYIPGFGGEVVLNALPDGGQSARVSGLYLYTQIRILRFIPIHVTLTRQNFSCPTGLLPLDGAAGSTEPLAGGPPVITGGSPSWLSSIFSLQYAARTRFSFVQPASALDIADFTQPALSAKYINGITSFSTTSTNSFSAQEQTNLFGNNDFNVPHLTFTARNGEFIFDQMEGKTLANSYCSTECTALAISSSLSTYQRLCPGASASFSVVNAPAGASISWSATPTNLFTTTSGSGPSFATSASGTYGTGTITATVTVGGTCPSSASTTVLTGTGEPTGTYSYPGGSYLTLRTVNNVTPGQIRILMDQPYNFTFTSSDANIPVYGSGQQAAFSLQAGQGVTIRATSPSGSNCGLAGNFTFTTNSGGYHFAATPNPASSDLTVTAVDDDQPETSATPSATAPPFEVELYDNQGKKVKTSKSDKGRARLDVRELPAGLYNVRAGKGKEAISKHIEITH